MVKKSRRMYWIAWLAITALFVSYAAYALVWGDQSIFLPGATTAGHYQIELACPACHKNAFGGGAVLQDACVKCHLDELKSVEDSHPKSKFTDPRNADRIALLDARFCVTCHREHRPDETHAMGVTLPNDFCANCHQKIAQDRPSHKGMAFDTCANAGCHNYHDNQALYEDFLAKHKGEADLLSPAVLPTRDLGAHWRHIATQPIRVLTEADQDAPHDLSFDPRVPRDWQLSAHARSGVNCRDCHRDVKDAALWVAQPQPAVCDRCHEEVSVGFRSGRHGMRAGQNNLEPMRPALARLPMKRDAAQRSINCSSCHGSHRYDTRHASVEGCLVCHDDEHSKAYLSSPHYRALLKANSGDAPQGSSPTCASCHLYRARTKVDGVLRTRVQHNQNLNLRPNEKMIRSVCMDCHGLEFTLDALADSALVRNNFNGRPARHIDSVQMAVIRIKEHPNDDKRKRDRRASSD